MALDYVSMAAMIAGVVAGGVMAVLGGYVFYRALSFLGSTRAAARALRLRNSPRARGRGERETVTELGKGVRQSS